MRNGLQQQTLVLLLDGSLKYVERLSAHWNTARLAARPKNLCFHWVFLAAIDIGLVPRRAISLTFQAAVYS